MSSTDLGRRLAAPAHQHFGHPDLSAIRRRGTRRRRVRTAAMTGAVLAVTAVGAVVSVGAWTVGNEDRAGDGGQPVTVYASPAAPSELSELARRALAEIDGATQVSPGQVVLPAPVAGIASGPPITADLLVDEPVDLGVHHYVGVTAYGPDPWPAWLHDGVAAVERAAAAGSGSAPVGTTTTGVLVDQGEAVLGCLQTYPDGVRVQGSCLPALLTDDGDRSFDLEWYLADEGGWQGDDLRLTTFENYADGSRTDVWLGGLDGTDVARVVLDLADGTSVDATVLAGDLVPSDTVFFAEVADRPRTVTAYDADGAVVAEHPIETCSAGPDCASP